VFAALATVPSGAACGGKTSCVDVRITPADRVCSTDGDCTSTQQGQVCAGQCPCGDDPVNQTALDAILQKEYGVGVAGCGCGTTGDPRPACVNGECQMVSSGLDAGGAAAADGGSLQLAGGQTFVINGVTDDGRIIYSTALPSDVWAVPFSGGVPTPISPPGFVTPGDLGYAGGATVFHHVVVMEMVSMAAGESSGKAGTPVSTWDERTGVTTTFTPPPQTYASSAQVSPDSQYIAIFWAPAVGVTGVPWSWAVSRVDGSGSVSFGPAWLAFFDQDWLVYTTLIDAVTGTPGAPLVALDGANGWSSVTLSTNAALYALDGIGSRALIANGPFPNGGEGVLLAPLDGAAPTVIDPTGGGPMLYLSPDSTFAMYTAEAETANAHVEAVTLPVSGPPGTPYPVTASALSDGAGGALDYNSGWTAVAQNAPGGPVALLLANPLTSSVSPFALVGVGPGAAAPNLTLPFTSVDGFTSDESRVLITRPNPALGPAAGIFTGPLTVFPLPDGPESAPLSASSLGWIPLAGSTVLFTDNYGGGWADVRIADVAKGTSSTLVASRTFSFAVSPDRTRLAYTDQNGLWVTVLPAAP
jgi:hypothetical protein